MFIDDLEVTLAVRRKLIENNRPVRNYENPQKNVKVINPTPLKDEDVRRMTDNHAKAFIDKTSKVFANYEHIRAKRDFSLPGELGKGYSVGKEEKEKEKQGYERHAFNQIVSEKISIYRSLKDYRNKK